MLPTAHCMRVIGHLDNDKDARTFGDFLYVQGIENEAERDDQRWAIWIHSDDQIPQAKKLFDEFCANPADPRYQAGPPAEKLREKAKAENEAYRKRVVQGRNVLPGLRSYGYGVVTYSVIVISSVVFVLSHLFGASPSLWQPDLERISALLITLYEWGRGGMMEIRRGEVWRLVTPIFIHFGILHILFNMMWLRDLGSLMEARLGSWYLLLFIIVIAAASNYGQYALTRNPIFGGMSGVVFGLIGYAWIRGRLDPAAGITMDRQSLLFALIFFALCFTGLVGRIANGAHAIGLIGGCLWAFIDSKRRMISK
jgi:GlpG protein